MANRGKVNDFFSIEEFEKQKKIVTDGIKEYVDLVDKIKPIRLDLQGSEKLKDVVDGVKKIGEAQEKAAAAGQRASDAMGEYSGQVANLSTNVQKNIKQQIDYKNKLGEIAAELKKLKQTQDLLSKTPGNEKQKKDIEDRILLLTEEQAQVKLLSAELTRFTNVQIREQQSLGDTLKQMRNELEALRNYRDVKLVVGSEDYEKAQQRILALNDAIKEQEQKGGDFRRNVGNYQGSAKIITEAFERAKQKVSEFSTKLGPTSPEARAARTEFEALERITANPQFLNISAKVGDTNKELRFFTQRLNELEDAGLKNSQVYQDVRARLAQLTDQIGDTKAEIKALSSDTRSFDLFAGSVNFAADVMQTYAGVAALAGANEEDVAKSIQTLVAIQSVANGVKGIANELTTKGTAANKAYAFVQGLVAVAMDKTAASAARLNAAMGLVAIAATVIGAIVIAMAYMNKEMDESEKRSAALSDVMKEAGSAYVEATKKVYELRSAFKSAREGLISKKEAVDLYNKSIGNTIGHAKDLNEAELKLEENADAYIKFTLMKAAANIALGKAAQKSFEIQEQIVKTTTETTKGGLLLSQQGSRQTQQGPVNPLLQRDEAKEIKLAEAKDKKIGDAQKKYVNKRVEGATKELKKEEDMYKNMYEGFYENMTKIAKENKFDITGTEDKDSKDKKDNLDKIQKLEEEKRKIEFEMRKRTLDEQIQFNETIVSDEKETYNARMYALRQFQLLSRTAALEKSDFEKNELHIQTNNQLKELEKRGKSEKLTKKQVDDERIAIMQKSHAEELKIEQDYYYTITAIGVSATNKLKEIDADLKDSRLEKAKELQKGIEKILNHGFANFQAQDKNRLEKEKETSKKLIEIEKERKDKIKALRKELYDELKQTITSFITWNEDKEIGELKDKMDRVDEEKARQIELVNQTVADKTKAAAEVQLIEERAQSQKEALEARQRQLEKKKANSERLANIANIVAETATSVFSLSAQAAQARAIAAVWTAKGNLPAAFIATTQAASIAAQIPFIIGIGAAQIARLAIPKYAEGTDNHPGGAAVIGDGGKKELVVTPDGKAFVSDNKPQLAVLPRGTQVFPDADKAMTIAMHNGYEKRAMSLTNPVSFTDRNITNEIKGMKKAVVRAIEKIPQPIIRSEGKITARIRRGDSSNTYLNNNLQ